MSVLLQDILRASTLSDSFNGERKQDNTVQRDTDDSDDELVNVVRQAVVIRDSSLADCLGGFATRNTVSDTAVVTHSSWRIDSPATRPTTYRITQGSSESLPYGSFTKDIRSINATRTGKVRTGIKEMESESDY